MRILVLSDSHGAVEACRLAVEQSAPDQILHLGDCVRDAERLHALFPAIPLTGVPGNCDWADADNPERLIELGGVRLMYLVLLHFQPPPQLFGCLHFQPYLCNLYLPSNH